MGCISPVPGMDDAQVDEIVDAVHRPVIAELARRGVEFRGCLYAGLMLTDDGPRVRRKEQRRTAGDRVPAH